MMLSTSSCTSFIVAGTCSSSFSAGALRIPLARTLDICMLRTENHRVALTVANRTHESADRVVVSIHPTSGLGLAHPEATRD